MQVNQPIEIDIGCGIAREKRGALDWSIESGDHLFNGGPVLGLIGVERGRDYQR
jgi:hypothetical protein